jgi:hypothetical protein
VTWRVSDSVTTIDSTSTHTDADGIASPGLWVIPAGFGFGPFTIVAVPNGAKLENAPLTLTTIIRLIGQALTAPPNGRSGGADPSSAAPRGSSEVRSSG